MAVRFRAVVLSLVLAGAISVADARAEFSAQLQPEDTLTEAAGGPGGLGYVLRCDPGTYLMGIGVRKGAWIDYAEPYCSAVHHDGQRYLRAVGGGQMSGLGAGNIGQPNGASARCSDLEFIVFGLFPTRVIAGDGGQFLGTFGVACRRMASAFEQEPGSYHHDIHIDPAPGAQYVPLGALSCGDQWAVGIHGGAGVFVDSIGLICGAPPQGAPIPPGAIAGDRLDLRQGADVGRLVTGGAGAEPPVAVQPVPGDAIECADCVRVFDQPALAGYPVDICLTWAEQCGQPAADAFCIASGFATAIAFEFQYESPPTRVIGTGEICEFDYCARFATISCRR
ncbi:MAG: hypothetical protein R3F55_02385 [Alphaproteobacteria bacterium]